MRISLFGLGYVGCVTAASLARDGHEVVGVDVSAEKVAMIEAAVPPVVEEGLGELLEKVVTAGRLSATTSAGWAVAATEMAMICVGTPGGRTGQIDLGAVERVGREIGEGLRERPGSYTVVLRSTVLPGTTERVLAPAVAAGIGGARGPELRFAVNPEFMREGTSLKDFTRPPMTLVGCHESETADLLKGLYASVDAPFVPTQIRTAEIVKYLCNTFHALKVCFANEAGDLCETFGIDPQEAASIFLLDRKLNLSEAYLRPGFAFGGSCLPKDLRALLHAGRSADLSLPLLEAVLQTRRRRVGVVGLSFKAGTDDLRESPMVTLVETLIGKGCDVRILDRNVSLARLVGANRRYIDEEIPHISSLMCDDLETLLAHSEVLVIGSADSAAAEALAEAGGARVVIDLTRGMVPRAAAQTARVAAG